MKHSLPLNPHDQPLFHAWNEGFAAAEKAIVVNPYAQDGSTPRLAVNFTEGFNIGRKLRKIKGVI